MVDGTIAACVVAVPVDDLSCEHNLVLGRLFILPHRWTLVVKHPKVFESIAEEQSFRSAVLVTNN